MLNFDIPNIMILTCLPKPYLNQTGEIMVCPLTSVLLSFNFNNHWDLNNDGETSDSLKNGSVVLNIDFLMILSTPISTQRTVI